LQNEWGTDYNPAMSILEGELAATIADALIEADLPLAITLTRTTAGSGGDPWNPPTGTTTTYQCSGFTDSYRDAERVGTLIEATDRKVIVIGATLLTTPEVSDTVNIQGEPLNVMSVLTDPARALWELQCRA
jgi:hypothetical protein